MLRELMRTIYYNLEGIKHQGPKLPVPATKFQIKYVIGGERFRTRPEGSVTVGPLADYMPVISFAGWFERHTWSEFLGETLRVMLGQLARNITLLGSTSLQDQEVFVIGFHGFHLHIARGFSTTAVIDRVHSKGCSMDDVFELNFTRGFNLCLKKDWFEATRALARLFRHLLSGNAKVGAMQAHNVKQAVDLASSRTETMLEISSV